MRLKLLSSFLIAGCLSLLANISNSNPLVVEGRTWWYHGVTYYEAFHNEYDNTDGEMEFSIGKKVELDGIEWNEVLSIKRATYRSDSREELRWSTDTCRVAFIREADGVVYTKFDHHSYVDAWWNIGTPCQYGILGYKNTVNGMVVYDYNLAADSTFYCGIPITNIDIKIDSVSTVENSGNIFNCFHGTISNVNCYYSDLCDKPFTYLDKVGFVTEKRDGQTSELFFAPLGRTSGNTVNAGPWLRYVTEGPDNKIIYTGMGGTRFWETKSGVEEIAVDSSDQPAEWFNLQGQQIESPQQPGIYICRQGSRTEKIIVR